MGRRKNDGWRVARAIFVLGCVILSGRASTAEAQNRRVLQQNDQGLPRINPDTIGANILLGIADDLKNFLNAAAGGQDAATENSTDAPNYLSGLEQPGGVDQAAPLAAQAPSKAPTPEASRTSALLTGAPVAAPSIHPATLKPAKAVAKAPTKAPAKGEAKTEGIIVIGNWPGWRPGPAPAPGPTPWDQPDLGDILRKLNLTTAHPSVLPHKLPFIPSLPPHTLPHKPPKQPPLPFPPSPSASKEQAFKHTSTTRKSTFSAADVRSFFDHTLAPEAALPLSEAPAKALPAEARAPKSARAPAARLDKPGTTAPKPSEAPAKSVPAEAARTPVARLDKVATTAPKVSEAPAKTEPAAAHAPEPAAAARAPAERLTKAATTAPTLQRRRRQLLDDAAGTRPPTPDQLAAQAASVKADFASYEKKLQASGLPTRTGHVLPPNHAANATHFPGTVSSGAPLPGPPATAGQRGNPVKFVPVPVLAPAPAPVSEVGASAAFPGIGASPPGAHMPALSVLAHAPAHVSTPAHKQ
ncbi:hypothetical protein COCOBI_11-4910 [Coccomyxa sp. Obi]|nr:hypothetical protein COCOBI_11-4910 [Coccomyxa sp. Obi]